MNNYDFEEAAKRLSEMDMWRNDDRVYIRLDDAKEILYRGVKWVNGGDAIWLPEYDKVADWLTDNKGRGLLMYGNCGRGKTLIGERLLPLIFNRWLRPKKIISCYTSIEMNKRPDDVLEKHIIYIDDIGIEDVAMSYGNKRLIFSELVDEAERKGKLLIISTNLSLPEISKKYGVRTVDRLKALTVQIPFVGESMRR